MESEEEGLNIYGIGKHHSMKWNVFVWRVWIKKESCLIQRKFILTSSAQRNGMIAF